METRGETNLGDYFLQYLRKKEEMLAHPYEGPANFRRAPMQPLSPRKALQGRLQRAGIVRKTEIPQVDLARIRDIQCVDETACYSFPL